MAKYDLLLLISSIVPAAARGAFVVAVLLAYKGQMSEQISPRAGGAAF